jgi:hypothetical protein
MYYTFSMKERVYNVNESSSSNPQSFMEKTQGIRDNLGFIREVYGVDVRMRRHTAMDIEAQIAEVTRLSLPEAEDIIVMIREELGKYPPEFLQKLHLSHFRVAKSLTSTVKRPSERLLKIAGLADRKTWQIYFAPHDLPLPAQRRVIHHEIFHMAESYEDIQNELRRSKIPIGGRLLAKRVVKNRYHSWSHDNPQYTPYLRDKYNIFAGREFHYQPILGHALRYGTMNESEDKATIADHLMTDPQSLIDRARRTNDTVLLRKIDHIQAFYNKWTQGKMDREYFEDLAEGRVSEGYFRT